MQNKLNELLVYAYENVEYYRKQFELRNINPYKIYSMDELSNFPIIDKNDIIENEKDFCSRELNEKIYMTEKTSGSTGIPFKVYKFKKDKMLQSVELWNHRRKFEITTLSRYCTWHIKGDDIYIDRNRLQFSAKNLSDSKLEKYAKEMYNFKPEWLFGGAEAWRILARYMVKNKMKIPKSVKFIESTGEILRKETRKELQEIFNCEVVDMYGCIECYGLAISCEFGELHWLENNSIVEIVDKFGKVVEDGVEGNIVITSLCNFAMPLIRYNTGDIGYISKKSCQCDKKGKCIKLRKARKNEYIIRKNEIKMDATIFHFVIEKINRDRDINVLQFKIIQKEYKKFELYVVLQKERQKERFEKKFFEEIKYYGFEASEWSIKSVSRIYMNQLTGKYQYFVNEMRNR